MTVQMLYSSVMSFMSWSITRLVFGSSPELGSSQKRYLGFIVIARAIATRFCIPPLISLGIRLKARSGIFTRSRQNRARVSLSLSLMSENISSGKSTFSNTVCESKSAEPWNSMPTLRWSIRSSFSLSDAKSTSRLSNLYTICPLVTRCSPIRAFISTVLPEPDCPIIMFTFPSNISVLTWSSTVTPSSKVFTMSFTSIILTGLRIKD